MVVTKPVEIRKEQKKFFSIAYKGEPVIVSRPRNENVVVISEEKYRELTTQNRLLAYYLGLAGDKKPDGREESRHDDIMYEVKEEYFAKSPKRVIGIAKGIELCDSDYDFDECNEEIAELFGVV